MSEQLRHSLFYEVFFPEALADGDSAKSEQLLLQRVVRYAPPKNLNLFETPLIVFDFETTGLDAQADRIIEIGAQRLCGFKVEDEFSTLIKPDVELPKNVQAVTGITPDMLEGQPSIDEVLPRFLQFIQGGILIAHNAEFDLAFLKAACERLGYELDWPCFCTLKLARALLPQLESKNLDTLASYYELTFEARHRSIGDVKVTAGVLHEMLADEGRHLTQWQAMQPYAVT